MLSIGVMQERVATPSTCTVQAPHSAMPQPNFVPVMPSTSRRTQSNGVSPSTSALCMFSLTLMVKAMMSSPKLWPASCRGRSESNQVDGNIDVAARRLGIWAKLVRFVHQFPRDGAVDVRQADVEAGAQGIRAVRQMQIHFGIDGDLVQADLPLVRGESDRAFEAGRPASREELLRIGADARRTGKRKLDVEPAVGAARDAVFTAADSVDLCRVDDGCLGAALFLKLGHGALP